MTVNTAESCITHIESDSSHHTVTLNKIFPSVGEVTLLLFNVNHNSTLSITSLACLM